MSRTLIITFIVIGIVLFSLFIFIAVKSINKNKKKDDLQTIDQASIDSIIFNLGGIDNIVSASIEGARISVRVKSVSQCHLEVIKSKGALGIFVTGTTIKMMLPYDSASLIKEINNLLKGEN